MTYDGGEGEPQPVAGLIPGLGDVPRVPAVKPKSTAAKPKDAKKGKTRGKKGVKEPAAELPVARVAVDMSLPHLDRPFDYHVPATMDDKVVPGCRVRVRFAGQLVDGLVLERVAESEHEGRLLFLERVTSPEPVLSPEIAALAREVADRYAGTLADVLRLAVPPRHARVEAEAPPGPGPASPESDEPQASPEPEHPEELAQHEQSEELKQQPEELKQQHEEPGGGHWNQGPGPWAEYPAGPSFLKALEDGRAPRAVWTALPGPAWPQAIARAVAVTLKSGRGALVVVADGRDVARVDEALTAELTNANGPLREGAPKNSPLTQGHPRHVALTAELGPAERYRRWLAIRRGGVRAVVGTRAAMFAPVADLGLVVLWDDGDDVHAEPHAPYPHPREVLALRAHRARAGALIGGFTRTTDATQLVESGWAHTLAADRLHVRQAMPRVRPVGDDAELAKDSAARTARLTHVGFETARHALESGPVLVQVPRRGYLPGLACGRCRTPARCEACQGPLALTSAHAAPYCRWCGRISGDWSCPECAHRHMRAVVVGARRTAEELGRAFPGVPVRTSGRDAVLARVGEEPSLVVSTPGAEPVAEGEGYAAALLLDGWVLLGRADLRAGEETLRRWMNAAALLRPSAPLVVSADGSLAPAQALLRWDPITYAERELAERREVGFPPAARMASLTGTPAAIKDLLSHARLPDGAEVLGPVPVSVRGGQGASEGPEKERALVRAPRGAATALARSLQEAQGIRSARKAPDPVRVQIDPLELI